MRIRSQCFFVLCLVCSLEPALAYGQSTEIVFSGVAVGSFASGDVQVDETFSVSVADDLFGVGGVSTGSYAVGEVVFAFSGGYETSFDNAFLSLGQQPSAGATENFISLRAGDEAVPDFFNLSIETFEPIFTNNQLPIGTDIVFGDSGVQFNSLLLDLNDGNVWIAGGLGNVTVSVPEPSSFAVLFLIATSLILPRTRGKMEV